jgi:hypothetical protein
MAISDGIEPPNLDWPSVTKVQSCRGRHQTLFPPLCGIGQFRWRRAGRDLEFRGVKAASSARYQGPILLSDQFSERSSIAAGVGMGGLG